MGLLQLDIWLLSKGLKREIKISLNVTLQSGGSKDGLDEKIKNLLEPYFYKMRKEWEKEKSTIIRVF